MLPSFESTSLRRQAHGGSVCSLSSPLPPAPSLLTVGNSLGPWVQTPDSTADRLPGLGRGGVPGGRRGQKHPPSFAGNMDRHHYEMFTKFGDDGFLIHLDNARG